MDVLTLSLLLVLWGSEVQGLPCNLCGKDSDKKTCKGQRIGQSYGITSGRPLDKRNFIASLRLTPSREIRGMHNRIIVSADFKAEGLELDKTYKNCAIMFAQEVPNSFFIDWYEIQRTKPHNLASYFEVKIDVELPQYLSQSYTVLFYGTSGHSGDNKTIRAQYEIPWHARYHRCSNDTSTHAYADIPSPTVYASCKDFGGVYKPMFYHPDHKVAYCDDHDEILVAPCAEVVGDDLRVTDSLCSWLPISQNSGIVKVPIPIGRCDDGPIVKSVTLFTTWVGTVVICYFCYKHRA